MKENISIEKFIQSLPDSETCLTKLFLQKFGGKPCVDCGKENSYRLVTGRKCFQCNKCLKQIYPLKGTIMENSKTDLRKWFCAMFYMSKSKNGLSAKQLSLDIDVTYKCAWRMSRLIRKAMSNDEIGFLEGIVEIDEAYIGGKIKGFYSHKNKVIILGMYQRKGKLKLFSIPNTSEKTILPLILSNVKKGSTIYTDEHASYRNLNSNGFDHEFITHKDREWVRGKITTNGIESCWARFKNSIRGTYIRLRLKAEYKNETFRYYLSEYEFRHNNKDKSNLYKFLKLSSLAGLDMNYAFQTSKT